MRRKSATKNRGRVDASMRVKIGANVTSSGKWLTCKSHRTLEGQILISNSPCEAPGSAVIESKGNVQITHMPEILTDALWRCSRISAMSHALLQQFDSQMNPCLSLDLLKWAFFALQGGVFVSKFTGYLSAEPRRSDVCSVYGKGRDG